MRPLKLIISAAQRVQMIHWGLIVLVSLSAVAVPRFWTLPNLLNVLDQSATLAILAMGQAFVIAGGFIDLSVGQLVGLITVIAAMMFQSYPDHGAVVILTCLGIATAVGLVNGELINRLKMSPLILTFGMLSVLQGMIFMLTDRSVGTASPAVAFLGSGDLAGIPTSVFLVALVVTAAWYGLHRSVFGWHLLALGHSADSARKATLHVPNLTRFAYMISGLCAGIAALVVLGRLGTGFPNAGNGLELDAIVAVVLGGTPLKGGRVNVFAIVSAVLFLGVLNNVLNLLQVPAFTQILVKGLIVIVAILADRPAPRVRPA